MSLHLNAKGYRELVDEDIAWLLKQPQCLEREHIIACLEKIKVLYVDGGEYQRHIDERMDP